jgi:hypothetical protein
MTPKHLLFASGATVLLLTGAFVDTASAQDRDRDRGKRECKSETIKSAGKASILGKGRATRLAIDNWQREVRAKYGERFMQWDRASKRNNECESASIGALGKFNMRCTVSGIPCAGGSVGEGSDRSDAFEIQRLLRRAGYLGKDDVDGEFGPKTRDAVRKFQRDQRLKVTGEIDDETFARLQRGGRGRG